MLHRQPLPLLSFNHCTPTDIPQAGRWKGRAGLVPGHGMGAPVRSLAASLRSTMSCLVQSTTAAVSGTKLVLIIAVSTLEH